MSGFRNARRIVLVLTPVVSLLLLLAGALVVSGSSAFASSHSKTLYVGQTAGTNSSCASPGYTSVQQAVDAAHNDDTVYLCGTTPFSEQVIITKEITLTGDPGATIQAPSPFPATSLSRLPSQFTTDSLFVPQAIVIVWGNGSNARITNLTINGPLPGNGGCASQEFGVLVIANGKATLKNDKVTNIHDSNSSLYGCQFGNGIQVGREYWPKADFSTFLVENFKGTATIQNTTVSGYQKTGIIVDGPKSSADIDKNLVQGAGRDAFFGVIIAQNGIQVSRGAYADVSDNYVADNSYTGTASGASSAGILLFGGCGDPLVIGVEFSHNTLINNDVGIYLNNYDPTCSTPPAQKTKDVAEYNSIFNDTVTNRSSETLTQGTFPGYQAGIDDVGNYDTIDHNTIGGPGYTTTNTTDTTKAFVIPIDTISFPTIHPHVYDNNIV
jgi:hypothetical protein